METKHERWEIEISALVDGELDGESTLPLIDHLIECAACRDFYTRSRKLAEVAAGADARRIEPAAELWHEIAGAAALPESAGQERRMAPRKVGLFLAAAAALLISLGVFLFGPAKSEPLAIETVAHMPSQIVLGGAPEKMTDQRFVEIATEVLEADPRYREELHSILRQVAETPSAEDGSVDSGWPDEATVFSEVFRSGSASAEWRSATF